MARLSSTDSLTFPAIEPSPRLHEEDRSAKMASKGLVDMDGTDHSGKAHRVEKTPRLSRFDRLQAKRDYATFKLDRARTLPRTTIGFPESESG